MIELESTATIRSTWPRTRPSHLLGSPGVAWPGALAPALSTLRKGLMRYKAQAQPFGLTRHGKRLPDRITEGIDPSAGLFDFFTARR